MEFFFWPPVLFIIFLMVGFLLYKLGDAVAPPLHEVGQKLSAYKCGDSKRFPDLNKIESSFYLFDIAVFFTILDLTVMMIATISKESNFNIVFLYFFLMVSTIVVLFDRK